MDFANGDKYTGDWLDDAMTGEGTCNFASGDRYEWRYSKIIHQPVRNG
jgi:hypothetical protein